MNPEDNQKNENRNDKSRDIESYYRIVKPLRTYERDISDLLREKGTSQVDIRLKEERKKREEDVSNPETSTQPIKTTDRKPKKFLILIIVIFLFLGGLFVISGYYRRSISRELEKRPSLKVEILIKGDIIRNIDTTQKNRSEILEIVESQIQDISIKKGRAIVIYPIEKDGEKEKALSAEKFMTKMTPNSPGYLQRAIGPKMTLGYSTKEGYMPFLLLEVSSPGNAFAGMLDWEKNMASDLFGFIVKKSPDRQSFEDIILKEKDLRVLKNFDGTITLLYSFIDTKTLLITGDIATFREVLDKFLLSDI